MRRVFVDLDGVLADFDAAYIAAFGEKNNHDLPEPPGFWDRLAAHRDGRFYADLPMLPDALDLWRGLLALTGTTPTVLTGIPRSLPFASVDKCAWVARHLGSAVPVICCASKDKYIHGKPGDLLIDDWTKYRSLWEDMGGVFILHTSAADSLAQVEAVLSSDAEPVA